MSRLFNRKKADVTHIPGEEDVDPEVLDRKAPENNRFGQPYKDSNDPVGGGGMARSFQASVGQPACPLPASYVVSHWQGADGHHIALKHASTGQDVCSWHGAVALQAFKSGMLHQNDLHGSALRFAKAAGLITAKDFVGQHKEDGSWTVREVPHGSGEEAKNVTDAPDGNKGQALQAPDAESAASKLHENMKATGVTPADREEAAAHPRNASAVVRVAGGYLRLGEGTPQRVVALEEASVLTPKAAKQLLRTLPSMGFDRRTLSLVLQ